MFGKTPLAPSFHIIEDIDWLIDWLIEWLIEYIVDVQVK